MIDKRILLVEDNLNYLEAAKQALSRFNPIIARNYDEAMQGLVTADSVITDLFYRENLRGSTQEIRDQVLKRINYGFVKEYINGMNARLREAGIEPNETLERCFCVLGLNQVITKSKQLDESIVPFLKSYGDLGPNKLEEMISNHCVIEGQWEKRIRKTFDEEISPLIDYMNQSPDNQPLGYLIGEEAERQGKPFVIATSLRHSEGALIPILISTQRRKWNLLEGKDGSKESPEFWLKAYTLLNGGEEKNKDN